MQKYTATITHHKISSARSIEAFTTLRQMKVAATKEFNGEMNEYSIVISDADGQVVATRRVDSKNWNDLH